MGKSSPRPQDVVGAAEQTGEQARILNYEQTRANRPNQANAWGQTTWQATPTWNPITGQYEQSWTQTETLDPQLQAAVDAQQNIQQGRSELAEGLFARAQNQYLSPVDFDQYGDPIQLQNVAGVDRFSFDPTGQRQIAEDAAYQRATSRLDPQFETQRQNLEVELRNRGLQPGDQAYDARMAEFGRARNDAYEQARLASIGEGRSELDLAFQQALAGSQLQTGQQAQEFAQAFQQNQLANALRQQQIQEDLAERDYPLTEVERLLQGQIVQGGPPSSGGETSTIASALGGG